VPRLASNSIEVSGAKRNIPFRPGRLFGITSHERRIPPEQMKTPPTGRGRTESEINLLGFEIASGDLALCLVHRLRRLMKHTVLHDRQQIVGVLQNLHVGERVAIHKQNIG
jgi:hypothetical protein